MDKLLTLKEAQSALKLCRCTVLKHIYSGALAASKLGNCWRISEADLTAFVKARRNV